MAAPVSLLRPSAPKKDRVVSNHPAPGEAQLIAIKDMAQHWTNKSAKMVANMRIYHLKMRFHW